MLQGLPNTDRNHSLMTTEDLWTEYHMWVDLLGDSSSTQVSNTTTNAVAHRQKAACELELRKRYPEPPPFRATQSVGGIGGVPTADPDESFSADYRRQVTWDTRMLELAMLVGSWSKDPSTKVGAVITRPDRTIASVGYNGFPRGTDDSSEKYADRPTKLLRVVHAEMNAMLAAREPLTGYTLYVTPLHPCANCAGSIIQAGIARVVAHMPIKRREEWASNFEAASLLFGEAGVKFTGFFQK